jgi:hypothetical protein
VVAAALTAALSLLSIVVIVFVRIPFEIKSRLCLLVVRGLRRWTVLLQRYASKKAGWGLVVATDCYQKHAWSMIIGGFP